MNTFITSFQAFADLDSIYEKKYAKDFSREQFDQIVALDPEHKRNSNALSGYAQWLLNLAKRGLLKPEDYYKATEYLSLLENNKADIRRRSQQDKSLSVDIFHYKTLSDLAKAVFPYVGAGKPTDTPDIHTNAELLANAYYLKTGQAEIVEETPSAVIVVPKSLAAAKYYSFKTEWCTQYPENWKHYSSQGDLFIIVYKDRNLRDIFGRLQVHFQSNQIMDILDRPVTRELPELIKEFPTFFTRNLWSAQDERLFTKKPGLTETEYFFHEGGNTIWMFYKIRDHWTDLIELKASYSAARDIFEDILCPPGTPKSGLRDMKASDIRVSQYITDIARNLTGETTRFLYRAVEQELGKEEMIKLQDTNLKNHLENSLDYISMNRHHSEVYYALLNSLIESSVLSEIPSIREEILQRLSNFYGVTFRISPDIEYAWEIISSDAKIKDLAMSAKLSLETDKEWWKHPSLVLSMLKGSLRLNITEYEERLEKITVDWVKFNNLLKTSLEENL